MSWHSMNLCDSGAIRLGATVLGCWSKKWLNFMHYFPLISLFWYFGRWDRSLTIFFKKWHPKNEKLMAPLLCGVNNGNQLEMILKHFNNACVLVFDWLVKKTSKGGDKNVENIECWWCYAVFTIAENINKQFIIINVRKSSLFSHLT